jgi:hypothetical protein
MWTLGNPYESGVELFPPRSALPTMDDPETGDRGVVEALDPQEAFDLVGHEIRLSIVRELAAADGSLSFGDLYDRVAVDDSGQFNYHLGKLVEAFVAHVDDSDGSDGGYRLTTAGRRVVGAVLSGGFTARFDADPVGVDGSCSRCGGDLEARFADERVRITCVDCAFVETAPEIPGGVVAEWPRERIGEVVARWSARVGHSAVLGFCPLCDGPLDRGVALPEEDAAPDWFDGAFADCVVVNDCQRCGHWWHSAFALAAWHHPTVAAFLHERGVDLRREGWWTYEWFDPGAGTVTAHDPLRVDLTLAVDGDRRTFTFDRAVELTDESAD